MSSDWRLRASCRDADTAVFFPERQEGAQSPDYEPALRLCQFCPVKRECLSYAMRHEEHSNGFRSGVWGFTTAKQRKEIAERHRREAS